MTHNNRKKFRIFHVLSAGCSLLRAAGFSCSLDVLFGGLGIRKIVVFDTKKLNFFPSCKFFSIWVIKPKDPDRYSRLKCWIRILIKWIRIRNTADNTTHWPRWLYPVLWIRIRDPVPFWPLDPGSEMGKKSRSRSDKNIPDQISESLKIMFCVNNTYIL